VQTAASAARARRRPPLTPALPAAAPDTISTPLAAALAGKMRLRKAFGAFFIFV